MGYLIITLWGISMLPTTTTDHTYIVVGIMVHTLFSMHVSHVRAVFPCQMWIYHLCKSLLHAILHLTSTLRPYPCYCYHQWLYQCYWVCIMEYVPHPVDYACETCQRCFFLYWGSIWMISNNDGYDTAFGKRTAAIFMLLLSLMMALFVWVCNMDSGLTPSWICIWAMLGLFSNSLYGNTIDLK